MLIAFYVKLSFYSFQSEFRLIHVNFYLDCSRFTSQEKTSSNKPMHQILSFLNILCKRSGPGELKGSECVRVFVSLTLFPQVCLLNSKNFLCAILLFSGPDLVPLFRNRSKIFCLVATVKPAQEIRESDVRLDKDVKFEEYILQRIISPRV